jgi:hypothetical protein
MNDHDAGPAHRPDGRVLAPDRLADRLAIADLVTAYAHAVDDRDWARWEALFLPDAVIDYTSAGGIVGSPAELAAWMPGALAAFEFCLHSTSTHEITFTGPDSATGRAHVFNRNGARWEGRPEIVDVGAVYVDSYQRDGDRWRFASRVEHTTYITGGEFAAMIRDAAVATRSERRPLFGA